MVGGSWSAMMTAREELEKSNVALHVLEKTMLSTRAARGRESQPDLAQENT